MTALLSLLFWESFIYIEYKTRIFYIRFIIIYGHFEAHSTWFVVFYMYIYIYIYMGVSINQGYETRLGVDICCIPCFIGMKQRISIVFSKGMHHPFIVNIFPLHRRSGTTSPPCPEKQCLKLDEQVYSFWRIDRRDRRCEPGIYFNRFCPFGMYLKTSS